MRNIFFGLEVRKTEIIRLFRVQILSFIYVLFFFSARFHHFSKLKERVHPASLTKTGAHLAHCVSEL